MFLKKQQQQQQLSSNLFNFCRRRRFYSEKSAFVFFDDCSVKLEEGDEAYVAFEVKIPLTFRRTRSFSPSPKLDHYPISWNPLAGRFSLFEKKSMNSRKASRYF